MNIKTIPLSRLETELQATLNECADSGFREFLLEQIPLAVTHDK